MTRPGPVRGLSPLFCAAACILAVVAASLASASVAGGAPAGAAAPVTRAGPPSPAPVWTPWFVAQPVADQAAAGGGRGFSAYTIDASAGPNGSISPSGSVTVPAGASQTFTMHPDPRYHVLDVVVDPTPMDVGKRGSVGPVTSYTFTNIDDDWTISVTFAIDTFVIDASAGAHGSISPSGAVEVTSGDDQTFTITADAGYHIADYRVDGTVVFPLGRQTTMSHTFTSVSAPHTIVATFAADSATITATCEEHGTIAPSGEVVVPLGGSQTFAIMPDPGWLIRDVLVDGSRVGPTSSYTFSNVTESHQIHAEFGRSAVDLVASAGPHGTITPSGTVSVVVGNDQTFLITPDLGYVIADVVVDDVSVGAVDRYTFSNVTVAHTIVASFAAVSQALTITASAGPHGSISPSGKLQVEPGSSRTFTITADAGYRIADVLVDGASVGAVAAYTFTRITASHTIAASFGALTQPDATPPEIRLSPFLSDGVVLARGLGEQMLFTVIDAPGGSGASTESTAAVLLPGAAAPTPLALTWTTEPDGGISAAGTLPTSQGGTYVLSITARDKAGNVGTLKLTYGVAGTARIAGLPADLDLSNGAWPAGKAVKVRLTLRDGAGRLLRGASPRLYVYDLASGVRLYRAARLFKPAGKGRYIFLWDPAKLRHDPAWGHDWRVLQVVIPLYDKKKPVSAQVVQAEGPGARAWTQLPGGHDKKPKKPKKPTTITSHIRVRW